MFSQKIKALGHDDKSEGAHQKSTIHDLFIVFYDICQHVSTILVEGLCVSFLYFLAPLHVDLSQRCNANIMSSEMHKKCNIRLVLNTTPLKGNVDQSGEMPLT